MYIDGYIYIYIGSSPGPGGAGRASSVSILVPVHRTEFAHTLPQAFVLDSRIRLQEVVWLSR